MDSTPIPQGQHRAVDERPPDGCWAHEHIATYRKPLDEVELFARLQGLLEKLEFFNEHALFSGDRITEIAELHQRIGRLRTRGTQLYGWRTQYVGGRQFVERAKRGPGSGIKTVAAPVDSEATKRKGA